MPQVDYDKLASQARSGSVDYDAVANSVRQSAPAPAAAPPSFNDERSATQVMVDQAKHAISGIPQAVTGLPSMIGGGIDALKDMLTGQGSGKAQAMVKGAVAPITTSARGIGALAAPESIEAPSSEEFEQAAEGAGANLGGIALGAGIGKVAGGVPRVAGKVGELVTERAPRRIMSSLIKPKKGDFDFGADPVTEVQSIGPTASLHSLKEKIGGEIAKSEAQLHEAAAQRAKIAADMDVADGMDIRPRLEGPLNDAIAKANRDGNTGLAEQIEKFKENRLADIEKRYGSTYLTPEEILFEKRNLGEEVKFVEDPVQKNLNTAKMEMYRGYDSALDTMLPNSKHINRRYSGLIEAHKLTDQRMQRVAGSDLGVGGGGVVAGALNKLPETLPKTTLSRMMAGRQPDILTDPPVYEFHPRPAADPYAQPVGSRPAVQLGPNEGVDFGVKETNAPPPLVSTYQKAKKVMAERKGGKAK